MVKRLIALPAPTLSKVSPVKQGLFALNVLFSYGEIQQSKRRGETNNEWMNTLTKLVVMNPNVVIPFVFWFHNKRRDRGKLSATYKYMHLKL